MLPNGTGKLIGDDIREEAHLKLFESPIEIVEPEEIYECRIALVDQKCESRHWHTFRYALIGSQSQTKPVSFKDLHEMMQFHIKEDP
jgi:hypothetical protein